MYYQSTYDSPVGTLTLASDGKAICGLWLDGQKYHGTSIPEPPVNDDDACGFAELRQWLDAYFAGDRPSLANVALAPIGSAFRQAVWKKLLAIPYGELSTYGAIASELREEGVKASPIAVGGAVGHNPISIVIPCHRVVGAHGNLTGYAGGLNRKTWLLNHEGVDLSTLFIPRSGTAL